MQKDKEGFEYNRVGLYQTYDVYRPTQALFLINDEAEEIKTVTSCYSTTTYLSSFEKFREGKVTNGVDRVSFTRDNASSSQAFADAVRTVTHHDEIAFMMMRTSRFGKVIIDQIDETRRVNNFARADTIAEIIEHIKSNPRNLTRIRQEPSSWVASAIKHFENL